MKKGRYQQAFNAFCRIRNTKLIAARELFYAHSQILAEENAFEGRTLASRVWDLFAVPRIRRATIASSIIVISQQFSGKQTRCFTIDHNCLSSHRHQHHRIRKSASKSGIARISA
jgi:hypothetical protein